MSSILIKQGNLLRWPYLEEKFNNLIVNFGASCAENKGFIKHVNFALITFYRFINQLIIIDMFIVIFILS